jgi:hypothetical protein
MTEVKEGHSNMVNDDKGSKLSKKAICIQMIDREGGATLDEMAHAIKDAGIDSDLRVNRTTASLWMSKLTDEHGNPIQVLNDKITGKYSRRITSTRVCQFTLPATKPAQPDMQLTPSLIEAAFENHYCNYAQKRDWSIDYHLKCWELGQKAFGLCSDDALEELIVELRKYWQAFRPYKPPTAGDVRQCLNSIDVSLRNIRLGDMADIESNLLQKIWAAIAATGEIKKNKDGPSLVATSKLLHFWNPRLFVIVDRQLMESFVFEHSWLRDQVEQVNAILPDCLPATANQHKFFRTNLRKFLAILAWAGRVLHVNKGIVDGFSKYVHRYAEGPVPEDLATYDAAAIEWLLLGLVHVPPQGVSFPGGDPEDM